MHLARQITIGNDSEKKENGVCINAWSEFIDVTQVHVILITHRAASVIRTLIN